MLFINYLVYTHFLYSYFICLIIGINNSFLLGLEYKYNFVHLLYNEICLLICHLPTYLFIF